MNITHIKQKLAKDDFFNFNIGIEREMLRTDLCGNLSTTDHKDSFGNKLDNPYVTTDFSESQIEIVTPPLKNSKDVCDFLEALYDICSNEYKDELLFPMSMPCIYDEIPIAKFEQSDRGIKARKYREKLYEKYGGFKQLLSGIHYNFSLSEELINKLFCITKYDLSLSEFKNNLYLKIASKYSYYRWFIQYIYGASPYIYDDKRYRDIKKQDIIDFNKGNGVTYRNSMLGYSNQKKTELDYSSLKSYVKSVEKLIDNNVIDEYRELYAKIRLKSSKNDGSLQNLLNNGIEYVEIRNIDINPYEKIGISKEYIDFLNLFILCLLFIDDDNYLDMEEADYNSECISRFGLDDILLKRNGKNIARSLYSMEIINKIKDFNDRFSLGMDEVIEKVKTMINDTTHTISYKIKNDIDKKGYINFALELSKKYKKNSYDNRYKLKGYEDLELSTQVLIKSCLQNGFEVNVLDRKDNFISISDKKGHIEYVKQATKTSKDNYATVLAMENKVVTKKILQLNHIKVPNGYEFASIEEALKFTDWFINNDIVIKPKSTNFGKGITIIRKGTQIEGIVKALNKAFSYDNSVIVEEYIRGHEYRFLVINGAVSGILERVPANVIGNGLNTIYELVQIKNQNPLRQKGYKSPLEKIEIDDTVQFYLKSNGMDANYIPKNNEIVYLRENSNISTGGDSIDYTDKICLRYKNIAIDASTAIGAKICGVDMIIEDYKDEKSNYAIIELNFNPAIHIHCFPYEGKERNIGIDVLKTLCLL